MEQDCDPTGLMKPNLIMKLSWDATRPCDAPKGKWNEGSYWNEDYDCDLTGEMERR